MHQNGQLVFALVSFLVQTHLIDDFILATVWFLSGLLKFDTIQMDVFVRTDERLSEHQMWMKRNAALADHW